METLIRIGGVYHLGFAVFASLWPRIFNWKEALAPLDDANRAIPLITSRLLVLLWLAVAYVSFAHTHDLLVTDLGRGILFFVSIFWTARAIMQVQLVGFKKARNLSVPGKAFGNLSNQFVSTALFVIFLTGVALYLVPAICSVG